MRIERQITEALVYGSQTSHRYTQDTPVLADVWVRFGEEPLEWQDLLLTPEWGFYAGRMSVLLRDHVKEVREEGSDPYPWWRTKTRCPADVAYNQVYTAARLYFDELIRVVLPMTVWWEDLWGETVSYWRKSQGARARKVTIDRVLKDLAPELRLALDALERASDPYEHPLDESHEMHRAVSSLPAQLPWFLRIVGVIARATQVSVEERVDACDCMYGAESSERRQVRLLATDWVRNLKATYHAEGSPLPEIEGPFLSEVLIEAARDLMSGIHITDLKDGAPSRGQQADEKAKEMKAGHVHIVNVNRPATTALSHSRMSVKADAAERLFAIDTSTITWAIIDTGIDATHPAFFRRSGKGKAGPRKDQAGDVRDGEWRQWTRVKKTYDFTRIRILLDPMRLADEKSLPEDLQALLAGSSDEFADLKRSLQRGRAIDWALLEPFLNVPHDEKYRVPRDGHGTHVAGILGADWEERDIVGICKDINLYDLRVIEQGKPNDEFAVLAALQFVQWLNAQKDFFAVHGVNLSLSIRHEVANFACGRTPVCDQCEDLISSGVTVVAAAGNAGYLRYKTVTGPADSFEETTEGYHTVSITDPGNAERVITVGSTHREKPHEYGVSYFSSRGPTGDGRLKPDLVAPGEKITSTYPDLGSRILDGTSMAAPHVSGAAAMLMARYSELIGQPERIAKALCDTATDLGREPYFQGAGLLDILRALQSI